MEENEIAQETDWRVRWKKKFERYSVEFTLIFVLLISGAVYVTGRMMNEKIANRWLTSLKPVIAENFARVGTSDDMSCIEFEDSSACEFPLLLGGRENLVYANLNLTLNKRHDIATMVVTTLLKRFFPQRESLWIEIPIDRSS